MALAATELERIVNGALGSGRWLRLEDPARMRLLEDFGIQPDTSQPLFLTPGDLASAQEMLDALSAEGKLRREWELCCPSCKRACVQVGDEERESYFAEHWVGFLADCPHCQAEFNGYAHYVHPVYVASDGYYRVELPQPRLRPSSLSERGRLARALA